MQNLWNKISIYRSVFQGFSKKAAIEWSQNKETYFNMAKSLKKKNTIKIYKKYLKIDPISGKYNNLVCDRLALKYILHDCQNFLLNYAFIVLKRGSENFIFSLQSNYGHIVAYRDIYLLLKEKRKLMIFPAFDESCSEIHILEYRKKHTYLNNSIVNEKEMEKFFSNINGISIIAELEEEHSTLKTINHNSLSVVTFIVANKHKNQTNILATYTNSVNALYSAKHIIGENSIKHISKTGKIDGKVPVPFFSNLEEESKRIASKLKELKLMGISWLITENGIKCFSVQTYPIVPYDFILFKDLVDFINEEAERQRKGRKIKKKVFSVLKEVYIDVAKKKGYMGFMMKNWHRDLLIDWLKTNTTIKEKLWAHRHGFLSFRIRQYDLTKDNLKNFLSDKNYRKIRPINNEFVIWVYDKVIMRYILDKEKILLPKYYFHLLFIEGKQKILTMPDLPFEYKGCIKDIIKLLEEKTCLILKPSEGSHGKDVFKLEFKNSQYYLNKKSIKKETLFSTLKNLEGNFNITEYIKMHPFLLKIYSKTTYTVRVMVINKEGDNPWIANAYIRIATEDTGVTDNVADGGIFAEIDINTGELYSPERIKEHIIEPCQKHPDSGVEISGYVPNWNIVKAGIKKISKYLFPLEYLGFDVVITKDSFKVLEINTHQDLHRYPFYDERIHDYFKEKVNLLCMN